jgi:Spy/CpxP family protein refolding chaperone
MSSVKLRWTRGGIAALAVCVLGAVAAGQPLQVSQLGQAGQVGQQRYSYLAIPGLSMLGTEQVQHDLELIDEQKEKLAEIAKKYQEQQRSAWADWRDVPAEERQARMAEIREETNKLTKKAVKEAEKVLLPHQLKALKKLVFRMRAQYSLRNPRVQEEIGLDEEQLEKLNELRQQLQDRIKELNEEMLDKTLEVLTPQQRKQLEDDSWKSIGQSYGYSGGIVAPAGKKAD